MAIPRRRAGAARRVRPAAPEARPSTTRTGKVRKAFWLDPKLLDDARAALGAANEREAIEMALDMVSFRKELVRGVRALRRLNKLSRID